VISGKSSSSPAPAWRARSVMAVMLFSSLLR
jgi:hypothetical protein